MLSRLGYWSDEVNTLVIVSQFTSSRERERLSRLERGPVLTKLRVERPTDDVLLSSHYRLLPVAWDHAGQVCFLSLLGLLLLVSAVVEDVALSVVFIKQVFLILKRNQLVKLFVFLSRQQVIIFFLFDLVEVFVRVERDSVVTASTHILPSARCSSSSCLLSCLLSGSLPTLRSIPAAISTSQANVPFVVDLHFALVGDASAVDAD